MNGNGRRRVLAVAVVVIVGGLVASAQVKDFKPVTDAMLQNPDPADWLNWRRTLDGWGYSPLNQINKENVHQLQLVWSWAVGPGTSQPAPLVYNGVMYIPETPGAVQAMDAVTGELIWEYKKEFETAPDYTWSPRTRSIAIYGDKIYVSTPDAHLVALDARTGKVVWDQAVADYKLGYRYTSGPIVAKGKVVAGMTGCERYKNDVCFISGHDAQTGKELWRAATIARPGEPGGETWGDLPLNRRSGGDAWIPGSYDPKTNLIYWSTAQAKPWARVSRGTDGDALYTNSTLAIDPETGKLVWYFQSIPGETHDLDEVFENVLIDYAGRSSLFKMGKLGILWEVDRKTGKFVAAHDLGYQNILEVNPQTGKVTYNPDMIPKLGVEQEFCPDLLGIRNWRATAYHPETQALYIPITPTCVKGVFTEVKTENVGNFHFYGSPTYTGFRTTGRPAHPASLDYRGHLIAMDIKSGKILWRHSMRSAPGSAALTTAGGLAIVGDSDRYLYIDDVVTGRNLFRTRLSAPVTGFPMTYAVQGKQYLAVPVGSRGSVGGNAMYVFALPERAALSRR
ncbi:MAG: PQQ-binding-like beta-propeller repeat protein [Candidatus Omnitrophica bacterium]|nr:PQQ-binding-like beta-propeller repeat protein [Candidatus Omnitrophota bacterium]